MDLRVASNLAFFGTSCARVSGCPVARPSSRASRCGCELPRILHPRTLPAMDLRVTSNLASFSTSGAQAPGYPKAPLLQLRLSMSRQVAPASASSGLAGDGSSSHLESRILQRAQRKNPELPRCLASGCACRCVPGFPRFQHLPAVPATRFSSCPESRVLRCLWCWRFEFPLSTAHPDAPPGVVASRPASCTFRLCLGSKFSSCPESSFPRRRLMVCRVASVPASSGCAVPASSGFPESCIYGWVNDDFPVLLELCILG